MEKKYSAVVTAMTLAALSTLTTGCASLVGESAFTGADEGRILISADRAGLEAFGDLTNGLVSNARISQDLESAHWKLRREQNQTRALRFTIGNKKGGK